MFYTGAVMDYLINNKDVFTKILEQTTSETENLSHHALVCFFGICDPFISVFDYNPNTPGEFVCVVITRRNS